MTTKCEILKELRTMIGKDLDIIDCISATGDYAAYGLTSEDWETWESVTDFGEKCFVMSLKHPDAELFYIVFEEREDEDGELVKIVTRAFIHEIIQTEFEN